MTSRTHTDIFSQVLEAAKGGEKKTKIMYKTFMSHGQLKVYLESLIQNQLIEYNGLDKCYFTTDKGYEFLRLYNAITESMERETFSRRAKADLRVV